MFEDLLFTVLFLLIPIFWYFLIKSARISLTRFSIPLVIIMSMFILQYLGIPILYFQLDAHRVNAGINDKFLVITLFLYTSITTTLLVFGFIFGQRCFGSLYNPIRESIRANKRFENIGLSLLFVIC